MKKFMSILIAAAMFICVCLSVSAAEANDSSSFCESESGFKFEDYEITFGTGEGELNSTAPAEKNDNELSKAVQKFKTQVHAEEHSINPQIQGLRYLPLYSAGTEERYYAIREEIDNNNFRSFEELKNEQAKFEEYLKNKCVASTELKDILTMFECENNFENYYDNQIWTEFTSVYEEAKAAYANKNEEEMHIAYIKCRNMFNKLCLYNTTFGDINHDGLFSVSDITYIQKSLTKLNPELNISQICVAVNFISNSTENPVSPYLSPTITSATNMQKYIAGIYADTSFFNKTVSSIIKHGGSSQFELYPENRTIDAENFQANEIYNMYLNQIDLSYR